MSSPCYEHLSLTRAHYLSPTLDDATCDCRFTLGIMLVIIFYIHSLVMLFFTLKTDFNISNLNIASLLPSVACMNSFFFSMSEKQFLTHFTLYFTRKTYQVCVGSVEKIIRKYTIYVVQFFYSIWDF